MDTGRLYLSTIDPQAGALARRYGLGVEIAEYCTAWNMDEQFPETNAQVLRTVESVPNRLLHAPFNELFPCAIDPKARELASYRYRQAMALAVGYGAGKVIIHGGYNPKIYFPIWYVEQSIRFWKTFLQDVPDMPIVLENVLEETPEMLLDIVKGVDDPRLRLCLDVGHAHAYSPVPVMDWLEAWSPWLSHFHIHNNDGRSDAHAALNCGSIPMRSLLVQAQALCPEATFTIEVAEAESSVQWILEGSLWN